MSFEPIIDLPPLSFSVKFSTCCDVAVTQLPNVRSFTNAFALCLFTLSSRGYFLGVISSYSASRVCQFFAGTSSETDALISRLVRRYQSTTLKLVGVTPLSYVGYYPLKPAVCSLIRDATRPFCDVMVRVTAKKNRFLGGASAFVAVTACDSAAGASVFLLLCNPSVLGSWCFSAFEMT